MQIQIRLEKSHIRIISIALIFQGSININQG